MLGCTCIVLELLFSITVNNGTCMLNYNIQAFSSMQINSLQWMHVCYSVLFINIMQHYNTSVVIVSHTCTCRYIHVPYTMHTGMYTIYINVHAHWIYIHTYMYVCVCMYILNFKLILDTHGNNKDL